MIRLLVISLVLTITGIVQGQENQNDNPSLNQATQTLDSLSWLAGSWGSEENGIETEEVWMGPKRWRKRYRRNRGRPIRQRAGRD